MLTPFLKVNYTNYPPSYIFQLLEDDNDNDEEREEASPNSHAGSKKAPSLHSVRGEVTYSVVVYRQD